MMKSYRRIDNEVKMKLMLEEHSKIKQLMNEMAMPLKAYVRKIEYYMYELVQNWCLCKWCQTFDQRNVNFNHWKKELRNCINQLKDPILKSNADKKKHLRQQLIDYYEFNDKNVVYRMIYDKFDDEHINDKKQIEDVAKSFANDVEKLIDLMSSVNDSTKQYVNSTFVFDSRN